MNPELSRVIGEARRPKTNKYGAQATVVDGRRFDSKAEARYYQWLRRMMAAGHVRWFCLQPSFLLEGGVIYRADFLVLDAQGRVSVEDVKGVRTREYLNKAKQVKARYGIEIIEVEPSVVK